MSSHGSGQQATHGILSPSLGFSFIKGSCSYNCWISLQGGDFHESRHPEGPKTGIKKPFVANEYYHCHGLTLSLNLFTFITTSGSLSPSSEEIKKWGPMKKDLPSLLAVQCWWPYTWGVNFAKDQVCLLNAAALFLTAEPSAAYLTPRGSFSSFIKMELACSLNRCMGIRVGIDVIPALSV